MQYLRRQPDVYTLRVTFGTAPQRVPGGVGGNPLGGQAHTRGLPLRPWSAVAELDWNSTDDTQASLRKLNNLTAAVRAEKPKARGGHPRCSQAPLAPGTDTAAGHQLPTSCLSLGASAPPRDARVMYTHHRTRRRSGWT